MNKKDNSSSIDQQKDSSVDQVRGPDLRKKMEESEQYGARFRAEHQGSDLARTDVKHAEKKVFQNTKDPSPGLKTENVDDL